MQRYSPAVHVQRRGREELIRRPQAGCPTVNDKLDFTKSDRMSIRQFNPSQSRTIGHIATSCRPCI